MDEISHFTEDDLLEAIKAMLDGIAKTEQVLSDGSRATGFDPMALGPDPALVGRSRIQWFPKINQSQEPAVHSAIDAIHNGRKRHPIEWPS